MTESARNMVADIRRSPIFASLPETEIERLAAIMQAIIVPSDAVLFHEDEAGDCLYVVQKGELEVIKALGTDQERLLSVSTAGDVIGEVSLLLPSVRRSASVRVRKEASLLCIRRGDFEALLDRHPKLALELVRILSARLREADDATISDLRQKNLELGQAYADLEAAQQQIIEQETLRRELKHANEIQQNMLPDALPELPGVELGARMVPARMVGGDFYDVLYLPDENRLVFLVGDVSGKGIPAALFMALSSSLLRAEACRAAAPVDVMRRVNRQLLDRCMKSMFVTAFYGDLNLATRELRYVRAGHDFPLMWDACGNALPAPEGRSQPLGLFPGSVLDAQCLSLPPGATMLLYTDGATEAMDAGQNLFGHDRLFAAATSARQLSAQALCDFLIQTVTGYQPPDIQMDDITFLALRIL